LSGLILLGAVLLNSTNAAAQTPADKSPVLTDESPKPCYSLGEATSINDVKTLFGKLAFVPDTNSSFYFIQLSDTHIYGEDEADPKAKVIYNSDLADGLKRLLGEINSFLPRPAFVVITGDLVHTGTLKQYLRLKQIVTELDPSIKLYLVTGNHDRADKLMEAFPGRQTYFSFDYGQWHFAVLDNGKTGKLDDTQIQWLGKDIETNKNKPLLLFQHYNMVQQKDFEPIRILREQVINVVKECQGQVWVYCGHWHSNYLVQCIYPGLPVVNMVATTAATNSFGYDAPGFRLVAIKNRDIAFTAFKRTGVENGFRIDPPQKDYPIYVPPPLMPPRKKLLTLKTGSDEQFINTNNGVGKEREYYFIDGKGCLVYEINLNTFKAEPALNLNVSISSDYIVAVSNNGKDYQEIFHSTGRMTQKELSWRIPAAWVNGDIYIKVTDRTPEDGFGAFLHEVSVEQAK
jgi:Icc protein